MHDLLNKINNLHRKNSIQICLTIHLSIEENENKLRKIAKNGAKFKILAENFKTLYISMNVNIIPKISDFVLEFSNRNGKYCQQPY